MLLIAVILEPLLELSTQPPLLVSHDTASLLQRLSPPLIDRVKAHHTLALFIVKQLVLGVLPATPIHNSQVITPSPGARNKEIVDSVGYARPPRGCGQGHVGGHGQVLRVAGAMAADEWEDEVRGEDVEQSGQEERNEDGLRGMVSS